MSTPEERHDEAVYSNLKQRMEQLNLAKILGEFVTLTENGANNYVGDCPFCLSPDAFYVNTEIRHFDCFGCGINGDIMAFFDELQKFVDDFPSEWMSIYGRR